MAEPQRPRDQLLFPGDYLLDELNIIPYTKFGEPEEPPIDVRLIMVELSIFQDLLSPGMTGTLAIVDALGVWNDMRHKNMRLSVKIQTPSMEERERRIEHEFYIYDIQRESIKQDVVFVTFKFYSPELHRNYKTNISRGFVQKPYDRPLNLTSNMVKALLQDEFPDKGLGSEKEFTVEHEPESRISLSMPYWDAFSGISWLTSHSYTLDPDSGEYLTTFFCYEDFNGYHLMNVDLKFKEEFISARPDVPEFFYDIGKTSGPSQDGQENQSFDVEYRKILDFRHDKDFNQLTDGLFGVYSSTNNHINLLTKEYIVEEVFPEKDWNSEGDISLENVVNQITYQWDQSNSAMVPLDPEFSRGDPKYGWGLPFYTVFYRDQDQRPYEDYKRQSIVNYIETDSKSFFYDGKVISSDEAFTQRYTRQRRTQVAELEILKISIVIFGRTDYNVGMMFNIFYPDSGIRQIEYPYTEIRYSGMYMATKMQHRFNKKGHYITMELTRNCLSEERHLPL